MSDRPVRSYEDSEKVERLAQPLTNKLEAKPAGPSLCYRCQHSMIYRRGNSFDQIIQCHKLEQVMPHDIVECSAFKPANQLSLYDMSMMAILISDRDSKDGNYL